MDNLLQFFAWQHLPIHLQPISRKYSDLADWMAANPPKNPESTTAMRKLLEAKDCAVRSVLFKWPAIGDPNNTGV